MWEVMRRHFYNVLLIETIIKTNQLSRREKNVLHLWVGEYPSSGCTYAAGNIAVVIFWSYHLPYLVKLLRLLSFSFFAWRTRIIKLYGIFTKVRDNYVMCLHRVGAQDWRSHPDWGSGLGKQKWPIALAMVAEFLSDTPVPGQETQSFERRIRLKAKALILQAPPNSLWDFSPGPCVREASAQLISPTLLHLC